MLIKTLKLDQTIQQALIATMSNEEEGQDDVIVVVTDLNIHFYSFSGRDVSRSLPFHGAFVYSLNPGILIHVGYNIF